MRPSMRWRRWPTGSPWGSSGSGPRRPWPGARRGWPRPWPASATRSSPPTAEGRVRFMNPVAETLTGWTQAEAAGRPIDDVFHIVNEHTREPAEHPVARVHPRGDDRRAGEPHRPDRQGRQPRRRSRTVPRRSGTMTGEVAGVVMVFRDVDRAEAVRIVITDQRLILEQMARGARWGRPGRVVRGHRRQAVGSIASVLLSRGDDGPCLRFAAGPPLPRSKYCEGHRSASRSVPCPSVSLRDGGRIRERAGRSVADIADRPSWEATGPGPTWRRAGPHLFHPPRQGARTFALFSIRPGTTAHASCRLLARGGLTPAGRRRIRPGEVSTTRTLIDVDAGRLVRRGERLAPTPPSTPTRTDGRRPESPGDRGVPAPVSLCDRRDVSAHRRSDGMRLRAGDPVSPGLGRDLSLAPRHGAAGRGS